MDVSLLLGIMLLLDFDRRSKYEANESHLLRDRGRWSLLGQDNYLLELVIPPYTDRLGSVVATHPFRAAGVGVRVQTPSFGGVASSGVPGSIPGPAFLFSFFKLSMNGFICDCSFCPSVALLSMSHTHDPQWNIVPAYLLEHLEIATVIERVGLWWTVEEHHQKYLSIFDNPNGYQCLTHRL